MPTLPPVRLLDEVIRPALMAQFLPIAYDTREARAMLLAWALQVEGCTSGTGPWCFSKDAILRVTLSPAVDDAAAIACQEAKIRCSARDIGRRIEADHVLACRLARLALSLDANTLPKVDPAGEEQGWHLLLRVTHSPLAEDPDSEEYLEARARWSRSWGLALQAVGA